MVLKLYKVLFIFLLILPLHSCETDDEDFEKNDTDSNNLTENFVISQQWWDSDIAPSIDNAILSDETEDISLAQNKLLQETVNYIFGLQTVASDMEKNLNSIVSEQDNSSWMNYYSSYLGAFVSSQDSRYKQWNITTDTLYEDFRWPYHLTIADLPDGNMEGRTNKALEIYYTEGFTKGIMIFSPSHFNFVRYTDSVLGHGLIGKLYFSCQDNDIENTLYISKTDLDNEIEVMSNTYLQLKQSNGIITMQTIVDMPQLTIGNDENLGYSLFMVGAIDSETSKMAVYSSLCKNTVTSPNPSSILKDDKAGFSTPSYFNKGQYLGSGLDYPDRKTYTKVLSKAEDLKPFPLPTNPLKISIYQVEW